MGSYSTQRICGPPPVSTVLNFHFVIIFFQTVFDKDNLFHRFALVNAGIIYMYCTSFQKIDEEEYGGAWELTKEGFMTSFAGFLVRV